MVGQDDVRQEFAQRGREGVARVHAVDVGAEFRLLELGLNEVCVGLAVLENQDAERAAHSTSTRKDDGAFSILIRFGDGRTYATPGKPHRGSVRRSWLGAG